MRPETGESRVLSGKCIIGRIFIGNHPRDPYFTVGSPGSGTKVSDGGHGVIQRRESRRPLGHQEDLESRSNSTGALFQGCASVKMLGPWKHTDALS